MEQFSRKQTYLLGLTAIAMFAVYTLFASPLNADFMDHINS